MSGEEVAESAPVTNGADGGEDAAAMSEAHPLHQPWVLWYEMCQGSVQRTSKEKWANNLHEIAVMDTVEDFWGVYNNIVEPSKLPSGSNYFLFKKGIKPCWEDQPCASGGRWVYAISRGDRTTIDTLWQNLSMSLVGENFDFCEDVCGIVCASRKHQDKVALWMTNYEEENRSKRTGGQMKEFMLVPETSKVTFQSFADATKPKSKQSKNNWSV